MSKEAHQTEPDKVCWMTGDKMSAGHYSFGVQKGMLGKKDSIKTYCGRDRVDYMTYTGDRMCGRCRKIYEEKLIKMLLFFQNGGRE